MLFVFSSFARIPRLQNRKYVLGDSGKVVRKHLMGDEHAKGKLTIIELQTVDRQLIGSRTTEPTEC